jgi:molybdopterin/thiamine biosynthesis adenylyltransferase
VGLTAAIVGVGGLGAPAALALARAGVERLLLIDDDVVDRSNLHRQILFRDADVGRSKLEATIDGLRRNGLKTHLDARPGRLTPSTTSLIEGCDVILECSDNYATKFLAADVARLRGLPIVHGSAIRFIGTAFAVSGGGGPCYRCLFEDIPPDAQAGCDIAGVVGPVCGVIGALQAHLALTAAYGTLISLDGLRDELRVRSIPARAGCPLCGPERTIDAIDAARYHPPVTEEN